MYIYMYIYINIYMNIYTFIYIHSYQSARKIGPKPEFGPISLNGPNLARISSLSPKKTEKRPIVMPFPCFIP